MSFTRPANFIDVFKIGDNINFNLKILKVLYDTYSNSSDKALLIKPIVILNTAIVEAILFDFVVNRLKRPNRTEVLFKNILDALRDKQLSKYDHYLQQIERYNLFELKEGEKLYELMHRLGKIRNRIHIQNDKCEDPRDESNLFTEQVKNLSECVLERIINIMNTKYPRREEYTRYVKDLELPWENHYPLT